MVCIVIIGVEHPGNLGAIARVMKNFGYHDLVLIDPQCSLESEEALNRAKHAQDVLQQARVCSLDVLDSFDLVIGTTAILGNDFNLPRTPLTPAQLSQKIRAREGNIALVFGRESDGLHKQEIDLCDFLVSIPTGSTYPALNLSHAVAVLLYELSRERSFEERFPLVQAAEKQQLERLVAHVLDSIEFQTPEKRQTQELLWKRLIAKSFLTQREAMALMGFLTKISQRTS